MPVSSIRMLVLVSTNFWKCNFLWHLCLLLNCDLALATNLTRDSDDISPIVVAPSEYFEGIDGPWSTFNLRVGTPEQDVRVTISTASPQAIVVLAEYGCTTVDMADPPSDCASSRGAMFSPNESSTWELQGIYSMDKDGIGLDANLGYIQPAEFGLETLGLGYLAGTNGPTLENQTVAAIATASPFYLGIFGLNTQPTNYTSLGNFTAPSYFQSLKNLDLIPSLTWSYTAGAQYRLKEVYGQLIFGGYDTSRFESNSASFDLAGDTTRDIVVAIQSITYVGTDQSTLLSTPILAFIDSTDPNIWLPESVCEAFEEAFGLVYDNTTERYLVNETHHTNLLSTNAETTFRIADGLDGGQTVDITLPYNAFDLEVEYPFVTNTSYYFPLKRAANDTQYTLGRAFLQEAYLTVDYERRNFSVSQCTWSSDAEETIVTIRSTDYTATSTSSSSSSSSSAAAASNSPTSVSTGAVIGIAVGCGLAAIILALVAWRILARRKAKNATTSTFPENDQELSSTMATEPKGYAQDNPQDKIETWLDGRTVFSEGELSNDSQILQLEDSQIFQLDGTTKFTQELDSTPTTPLPGHGAEKQLGYEGIDGREELPAVEIHTEVYEMAADPVVSRGAAVSRNVSMASHATSVNQTLSPAWDYGLSNVSRNSSVSVVSPASEGGLRFGSPSPLSTPLVEPLVNPFADGVGKEERSRSSGV